MNPDMRIDSLRVELLGGLRIAGADGEGIEISSRQAGRVLAYLALNLRRKHGREELVDLFWPDDDVDEGRAKLSKALHTIRGWIAQAGVDPPSALLAGRSEVRLNGAVVTTDAAELEEALKTAADSRDAAERTRFLDEAVRLYRGELLPGFYDKCFDAERNRISIAYESALHALALAHEQLGEIDRALEIALRAVALSPSNEDAHCAVMRLLALKGQPGAVTRQYRELERALEAELGEKPCENTRLLMESLARSGCETRSTRSSSLPSQHNLPQPTTRFIGREKEIAEIRDLLEKSPLLTMTGSGGCGKTRLAYRIVEDLLEQFPDGIWVAELAALADPELVPQAVASALHLREEPGKSLRRTLAEHLKNRSLLLLLDNCEHLLAACAGLADLILRECPRVRILCTSRERLGVPGEQTYRVPSLAVPEHGEATRVEVLPRYEAVRLFVDRARLQNASFAVTDRNADALASVCRGLDGIPLAIELAAARIRSMSVEELNHRLDDRFRLLTGGSRTALPRQQTLRALIDWSYDLLNEVEKALLCRLSVFAGGWTVEAAEKVCSDFGFSILDCGLAERPIQNPKSKIRNSEVLDLLSSLADKSLVVTEEKDGATRYRLLDTVRQYARDRLLETADTEIWRCRHLDYFLGLAEEAEPRLLAADQHYWMMRLSTELDNLRAALLLSSTKLDDTDSGLRLAAALMRFWGHQGHQDEGRRWISALLAAGPPNSGDAAHAKAISAAGELALGQGDYPAARELYDKGLAIWRDLGDRWYVAFALNGLARVYLWQGDYPAAKALLDESLAIRREMDDSWGVSVALSNLGEIAMALSDYPAAHAIFSEYLQIERTSGNPGGLSDALYCLGLVVCEQGDIQGARALHDESMSIKRGLGSLGGQAEGQYGLGLVEYAEGDYQAACALHKEALFTLRRRGDRRRVLRSLNAFACAATRQEPDLAARMWGAAQSLEEQIGSPMPPNEKERFDQRVAVAREALGIDAFAAAWADGRAMSMDQAIDFALSDEES